VLKTNPGFADCKIHQLITVQIKKHELTNEVQFTNTHPPLEISKCVSL